MLFIVFLLRATFASIPATFVPLNARSREMKQISSDHSLRAVLCKQTASVGKLMEMDGFAPGVVNTILVVANILNTLKITNLTVPELVLTNTTVVLDCEVHADDEHFTLRWLLDNETVYVWKPYSEPVVCGLLEGRLDLNYRPTKDPLQERRALRIPEPTPELSGQYACAVDDASRHDSRAMPMLVYSPEEDFSLSIKEEPEYLEISCVVKDVYPQPVLMLESNQMLIPKQDFRVWRSDGPYYDASCEARVPYDVTHVARGAKHVARVACRLHVPHAGYSAVREVEHRGSDNAAVQIKSQTTLQVCILFGILFNNNNPG